MSDAIFTLKQLVEKRMEFNLPTYILFIYYEKPYDRVNRSKLIETIEARHVDKDFINAIKALYKETYVSIKIGNILTEIFTTNIGLKQECGLSPLLFNVYIDQIVKLWKLRNPKRHHN